MLERLLPRLLSDATINAFGAFVIEMVCVAGGLVHISVAAPVYWLVKMICLVGVAVTVVGEARV